MPRIDKTDKYYRVRQKDPNEFQENSFRIVPLSEKEGIYAVMGKLKSDNKMTVQSILFEVEKWDESKVRKWVKEHDFKIMDIAGIEIKELQSENGLDWIDYAYETEVKGHPRYNEFAITRDDLMSFIENFKLGIGALKDNDNAYTLPVDIDHGTDPKYGRDAVAWIKDFRMIFRSGKYVLQAGIKFISDAFKEAIKNGIRRYFSPSFANEYIDPESGKKYRNVALGGAFTNYPTLRDLEPITLNVLETEIGSNIKREEDDIMDIKELMEINQKLTLEKANVEKELTAMKEKLQEQEKLLIAMKEEKEKIAKEKEEIEKVKIAQEIKALCDEGIMKKKLMPAWVNDDGWFKQLCNKDIVLAKQTLEKLPEFNLNAIGTSHIPLDSNTRDLSAKEFDKLATELSKSEKISYEEASKKLKAQGYSYK